MSNPTPAQRALTERHKPGAVLSQKEQQGRTIRSKTNHQTPFFAPNENRSGRRDNPNGVYHRQPTQPLSTQFPNPLLDVGSQLLESPLITFDQEVESVDIDVRVNQQEPVAPSTLLPVVSPLVTTQQPGSNDELKTAFPTDFRAIGIDQNPVGTEPVNAQLPAETVNLAVAPLPDKAPTTPEQDLPFQTTLKDIRQTRRTLRHHPKPEKKVAEYTNAAVLPESTQKTKNARSQHLNTIDEKAEQVAHNKQVFKPETFKELLKKNLAELESKLPHDEKKAKQFKREKPLEAIKQTIGNQVTQVNTTQLSSVSQEVGRQAPPPSSLPVQTPQTYKAEPTGPRPQAIDPAAATPKPKTDAEISMEAESRSMDDLMAARKMTDQQLAESNEPSFLKTLDAKQQAKQKAAEAPQVYRQVEQQTLTTAQKKASGIGQAKMGGMFTNRQQTFLEVFQQQNLTELLDKGKQILVDSQFQAIYDGTKNDVKRILDALSTFVDDTFTQESDEAKKQFEKVVEDKLDDIHGLGVKDFFFGEDTEAIEKVFEQEGSKFKRALGNTLDKIADEIANRLNEAVSRIEKGRQDAQALFDGLSKEQQQMHSNTFTQFSTQFDNLQSSVDEKQAELAHSLAESYKANVDSLRETFDKINEQARKTWIDKAAEFIEEAATAIYRLGQLLLSVLVRLADLIGDILAHPIRFLEHVGSGLKLGFSRFADKFDEYLLTGFFDWLRGSVAGAGIRMPDSFDPKGLFSLATQLVGLDYATFREVAVDKLGSPVVEAIEKGEEWVREGVEKGIELFEIVKKDGLGGLWEHVKSMITEGVSELFDKIKKTILYETIKKVLAYVATLFNPVGAFIQAALALYHGIQFLIDNIDRLEKLVNAFLDSLELAVKGDVSGIADKIVFALRNAIVLAIDFLAKLLNLGSLVDKARHLIKTIRTPIIRAMGWAVDKFKPLINRAVKGSKALIAKGKQVVVKGKEAIGQAAQKVGSLLGLQKYFKTKNGESHRLFFDREGVHAPLMVASTPRTLRNFVTTIALPPTATSHIQNLYAEVTHYLDEVEVVTANTTLPETQKTERLQQLLEAIGMILPELMEIAGGTLRTSTPPVFAGLSNGFGRGVRVEITGRPAGTGSDASAVSSDWSALVRRRQGDGSYYVRGHLLSQSLGGNGAIWENLTPLTQRANQSHEGRVERNLKRPVRNHQDSTFLYVVMPNYGRQLNQSLLTAVQASTHPQKLQIEQIVRLEQYVPTTLICSVKELDPLTGKEVPSEFSTQYVIDNSIEQSSINDYNVR